MPSALTNHASIAEMIPIQREGDIVGNMDRVRGKIMDPEQPVVDQGTHEEEEKKKKKKTKNEKPNKHTMDYMTRTFVAGGIAGCAVGRHLHTKDVKLANLFPFYTGQDNRRTSRPSQDPFPDQ
jgi:hypothetical protein